MTLGNPALANLFKSLWKMTWAQRFRHLEAGFALLVAKVMLWLLPFRWITGLVGFALQSEMNHIPNQTHPDFLKWSRALGACSRRLPFSATCLVQALAAAIILKVRRQTTTLCIGVHKTPEGVFTAHAWLLCHGKVVTGGRGHQDYTLIAKYIGKKKGSDPN